MVNLKTKPQRISSRLL